MAVPEAGRQLVLASGSPRRRELLEGLGVELVIHVADIDESAVPGELPEPYVRRLAESKARTVGAQLDDSQQAVVLAADTIVAVDNDLLGKPRDDDDASRMLARLAGREHEVLTGVAVLASGGVQIGVERTRVRFAELTTAEIAWYVGSGEPLDKAGAYAIQGLGALFVEAITGNYSNVVGLPLPLTYRLLQAAGFALRSPSATRRT
ncbi:MAG: Maf family protein [Acidobacteriota bacterium]